jgi:aspartyl-tRNA(Asn)/glutamyl-tRNA(Gln) amidotransferase subunit A
MAGPDPRDPICSPTPPTSITPLLQKPLSAPPRLGRLRGLFEELADGVVLQVLAQALDTLEKADAMVREAPLPTLFNGVIQDHRAIMACEAAAYHEQRFHQYPEDYLPRITELVTEGLNMSSTRYIRARQHQAQLKREILASFQDVDVLVCPATTSAAPDATTTGDPAFNSPWSFTGLPVVSFPIGLSADGLPLGMQLVGRPFDEPRLFQVALWCEQIVGQDLK